MEKIHVVSLLQMSFTDAEEEEDEDKLVGDITWRSYRDFFMAGSSLTMVLVVFLFSLAGQLTDNLTDWWLVYWYVLMLMYIGQRYS